jgi:hypothetical protein
VVQEREIRADNFEDELNHPTNPDDCFLNLAQLRSATHVQQFRSPRLARSLTDVIEDAIQNKARSERETREAQAEKEAEKARRLEERQAKAAQKAGDVNPSTTVTQNSTPPPGLAATDPQTAAGPSGGTAATGGQKRGRSGTSSNIDGEPVARRRARNNVSDLHDGANDSPYQNIQWSHYDPHAP